MNWDYIAGFFDGEGNICICGNSSRRACQFNATFAQSGRIGLKVLSQIKEFLQASEIPSHIIESSGRSLRERKGYAKMYQLRISGRENLRKGMFPKLIVKKIEAQDSLRYLKLFPTQRGLYFRYENPKGKIPARTELDVWPRRKAYGSTCTRRSD